MARHVAYNHGNHEHDLQRTHSEDPCGYPCFSELAHLHTSKCSLIEKKKKGALVVCGEEVELFKKSGCQPAQL
jgi:hypothetical protein